ncbi:unnamed protein product [Rodentolepis nana]|uniref:Uncharacterized protein n=1 Tax=Rodentolepis nana TaxID=102285 RepID=A0A0R3TX63_RODNA|nr:unnamed protein product [Rodentolepis nana]
MSALEAEGDACEYALGPCWLEVAISSPHYLPPLTPPHVVTMAQTEIIIYGPLSRDTFLTAACVSLVVDIARWRGDNSRPTSASILAG